MRVYKTDKRPVRILEPYDGSAMFIASYVLQILLQFILMLILQLTSAADAFLASTGGTCVLLLLNESAILITPLAYSKIRANNLYTQVGFGTKIGVAQILIAIATAFATIMAFSPIAEAFVWLVRLSGYNVDALTTMQINSAGTLVVGILFMCVLPAICEELLYRGMLSRAFGDNGVVKGILLSAFFFAIMHGNPVQLVHQFFLGAVCAVLYYMTRSIWIPVIVHLCNNLYAVVGSYIQFRAGEDGSMPVWGMVLMSVCGLVVLGGLLCLMYRASAKTQNKRERLAAEQGKGKWLRRIRILYLTQEEEAVLEREQQALQDEYDACENDETREMLLVARKEEKARIDRRNRRALIYASVLGLAMWAINTISGYIG